MIQTENDLFNFVRQNIYGNKIVIEWAQDRYLTG